MPLEKSSDKKVALVAHCILNQRTVAPGLASYEGAVKELVEHLVSKSYGIVQLPCPEATYLGLNRWWMSREQYDNLNYRRHCRKILLPVITLIKEFSKDGIRYVVIGIKGSPSCGVFTTTSNPKWRGNPVEFGGVSSRKIHAPGVFMEELLNMVKEANLPLPDKLIEIDHEEIKAKGLPANLQEEI